MMARAGSGRLRFVRGFDRGYNDTVDYIVR